ncbi:TetR family transcriptional regulator [Amycolatopsis orientalis]|uniref:TetR family transcriptional regulator n=1 Tax=Amycolatopsis orientalis TaxID=31958 RepID=A0A193C2W8_AMYOR|nr:TetR/AcrR family transcriptional regulator [Amycolatopsis orientalis]ANN18827.1 TetR family transcriptional regulator [Amycolatopsis orientalis]
MTAGRERTGPVREPRVTKRRAETRRRLLDAALEVFAREGFGRATVDEVCAQAGYTRGAFYSNFVSLDELFLAMWEERSAEQIARTRQAFEAGDFPAVSDVDGVVGEILRVVPMDEEWYRVSAEFTAHALRTPGLRKVIAARERAIAASFMPLLLALLARICRTVPDPDALGQALIAVHDGTAAQCFTEPDDPVVWQRRAELFGRVITAYSIESRNRS